MKGLLFFLVLAGVLLGSEKEKVIIENKCVSKIDDMNDKQKEVLVKSYHFGLKHDLGYTMAAIAWQESCAGEYRINFQDPSAGIFHTYIPGVFNRHPHLKRNGLTENIVGEMLIQDDSFSARETLAELLYWKKRHDNKWSFIVKSYNKGNSWLKNDEAKKKAERYHAGIVKKMRQLKGRLHIIDRELQYARFKEQEKNLPFLQASFNNSSRSYRNFKGNFALLSE